MTDDIVTRLREPGLCGWATQKQAADEIERLRADRDRWFKIADVMAGCLDSSTEASDALRVYEQAVRGD